MHQLAAKAAEFPKPNLSRHHHRDLPGRQHRYQGHEPLPDKSKARFVRGSVVVLHVLGEVVPLRSRGHGVTRPNSDLIRSRCCENTPTIAKVLPRKLEISTCDKRDRHRFTAISLGSNGH